MSPEIKPPASFVDRLILFCLRNRLAVFLLTILVVVWGILVAPFDWDIADLPRDRVPVDAIPDIGENQQIVFTEWPGRSPQDMEDQVTYPLTVALLGIPEVKTVRSFSMFGFSSIYVIFNEEAEFYWSRSRIIEKLNSLPSGTLPDGVQPALGPDATPMGQVFWYTLEGQDPSGNPTGGWDPQELRSIQDFYVRYALQSVEGVSEVASVGGFVKEYQIDIDPDAMRAYKVTLNDIFMAVRQSNLDVGARTIEINRVEYVIRGLGFIKSVDDLRKSVVKVHDNVPITLDQIAVVNLGPAMRRGVLDKEGAEAVGGVVVVRYGANPLEVIDSVHAKIDEISAGLPQKVLPDGTKSKVALVPFYDRTGLIQETLETLNTALVEEALVTVIVVLLMVMHLRSSVLISMMLPLAVLMAFIGMKKFGVDANIVALSGIAIAIGTIVDMGIVVCESVLKHLEKADAEENRLAVVYRATSEVGSAVMTAVLTTVISFLPVFFMEGAEGKLFRPLAYTKTFALIASIIIALTLIPPLAHLLLARKPFSRNGLIGSAAGLIVAGVILPFAVSFIPWWLGLLMVLLGIYHLSKKLLPGGLTKIFETGFNIVLALVVGIILANHWQPLGPEKTFQNIILVTVLIGGLIGLIFIFMHFYENVLRWCLANKIYFLSVVTALVLFGGSIWLGFGKVFGFMPGFVKNTRIWAATTEKFPGLGKEFMPPLDEGSFLYMPTTMPHASIGEVSEVLKLQDSAIRSIPEVENVVGKAGRVDSPLDPAPVSMIETVVTYKPEYIEDIKGHKLRFKFDRSSGEFIRDAEGKLIEDPKGRPYRQWREQIQTPDDIWNEIVDVAQVPGTTSAPKLQPIAARLVMLQTGMRAPLGMKIYGPNLETIETTGRQVEQLLKEVPSINPSTVFADRIVGKPYLEVDIDRDAIARYGMTIEQVQKVIEVAVGGRTIMNTVEGRERYPVRVRYMRELRDDIQGLERILVPAADGAQIPLTQLADLKYVRGPQSIKSEDTFLVGYVIFDKKPGYAEVDVVETAQRYLADAQADGRLSIPAGVNYRFTGAYENQVRAEKKLKLVVPLALFLIFMIIYFQFRSVATTMLVFTGIFLAWSGGFILLWCYGQDWFLNFSPFGVDLRELFQIKPINLSIAVWVGFLALFGIATDDGVLIGTYLKEVFQANKPQTVQAIHEAVVMAGKMRIRPAMMTIATTLLALLPVLTSTGRGSDVMVPMAIPSFGGMLLAIVTVFLVPTLYCMIEEWKLRFAGKNSTNP